LRRHHNQDMSERKQAEEITGLLAAIVASSDDAIISKNLDGIITSWNVSAERIFGYTPQEAIGEHVTLIIPPERHAEESDILDRLRRGERVDHFHTVRRRKDGSLLDVSLTISPVRDSSGRVIGASKVARDISAQKQADRALRESEQRFRVITDASPIMVWMSGMDKLCYYFNKGWLDFSLRRPFHRKASFHPPLFAFGVVRHVGVSHRRQFTGGVFAGVSMIVRAVGDDLSIFLGQQLGGEFLDSVRGNVHGSG
jgi:PAS domain S-box-containing protein